MLGAASTLRGAARLLALGVLVLGLCTNAAVGGPAQPTQEGLVPVTTPQGVTILAELADTTEKRARGLMFRDSLPKDRGMLFTFPEPQPWTFWMKNTRIALDIIWIDATKKVIHIERNVPGCLRLDDSCPNYQPNGNALYVLEVGAGIADGLQLDRGTKLKFQVPPTVSPIPR